MLAIIIGTEERNMKTYQSNTKDKKKNFFKRHKYAVTVTVCALVIAAIIVLSVVFTLPETKPAGGTVIDPPTVDAGSDPTVMMPMKNAQICKDYADTKLVKWETLDIWQWHPAVDFLGEGDVFAVLDGKVTNIERTTMDGNVVTITHSDGYVSIYKSLGSDISVKIGDEVKAGSKIGVTSTSMMSELNTGAHLHFELKKNGKHVDPATLLPLDGDK